MSQVQQIDIAGVKTLLEKEDCLLVDIREPAIFQQGHIPGAVHLGNHNLEQVLNEAEFDQPVVVCCYHGISSISVADYLIQRGFEEVYSLVGGFEAWARENNSAS